MNFVVTMRILGLDDEKQTEPFLLPAGTEWPYFQAMIESLVDVSDPTFTHNGLDIRYWDEEDLVILSSQDELDEACRLAAGSGLLQLFIRGKEDSRNFVQYQPNLPSLPPLPLLKYPYPEDELTKSQGFSQTQGSDKTFVPYELTLVTEDEQFHQPSVDEMLSVEEAMQDFRPAAEMLHRAESLDGFAYGMPAAEHTIVPGAASGANVIAIEMPECATDLPRDRHAANGHGTETAEPAEMAETGEVSPKSGRDAETGFWMVQKKMVDIEQAAAGIAVEVEAPPAIPPRHPLNPVYASDTENPVYTSDTERMALEEEAVSQDLRCKLLLAEQGVLTREDLQTFMEELKDLLNGSLVKNVGRYTALKVLGGLAKMKEQESVEPCAAAKKEEKKSGWPAIVHDNFFCDNCDKAIVGPRYKCGNCDDYDLCEKCEDIFPPVHDNTHTFVKLRYPAPKAGTRHGEYVHLLRTTFYITKKDKANTVHKKERELEELRRIQQGLKSKEQKLREKLVRNAARMQRRLEQASPKDQQTQVSEQAAERLQDRLKRTKQWLAMVSEKTVAEESFQFGGTCIRRPNLAEILSAVFVCDNTVPDGMLVRAGQRLSKQWVMRNSGTITWPLNTVLREEYSTMQATESEVLVGQVAPGDLITITVELVAPEQTGEYESRWHLYTGKVVFGHVVYCKVRVDTMITPASACPTQEGERLDLKSAATGMGDGSGQPQQLDRKKSFRWLDEEGAYSGLPGEEAEAHTNGSAGTVDAAAACILMTKCSPAMPSTPNNTPFGCSRAVTPPPEDDIITGPASHTDALFRQELVDSLKKSATISALEEVAPETESCQYGSVSWTCLQPSCPFAGQVQPDADGDDQALLDDRNEETCNSQAEEEATESLQQKQCSDDALDSGSDTEERQSPVACYVESQRTHFGAVPLQQAALFLSSAQPEDEDLPEEDGDRDVSESREPLSPSSTTSSVMVMSPDDQEQAMGLEEDSAHDYAAGTAFFPHSHSLPLLPVRSLEDGEGDGYEMLPGNDLDSFSSSVSTDTEDDFCIVMPDCFDLTKPLEESYDPQELAKVLVSVDAPTSAEKYKDTRQPETEPSHLQQLEPPHLEQLEEKRHRLEASVFTPCATVCSLVKDSSQQLPPNTLEGQPWTNADVWEWFPNHPLLPIRPPAAGISEEAESLKDESCTALPVSACGDAKMAKEHEVQAEAGGDDRMWKEQELSANASGDDKMWKEPELLAEEAADDTAAHTESSKQPAAVVQLMPEPAAQEPGEEPAAHDEPASAEEETAAAASPACPVGPAEDQSQQSGASHEAAGDSYPLDKFMESVTRATGSGLQFLLQTTKDVFKNLQAAESHKPRESNYTPPKSTWAPTKTQYIPPRSDYQPPKSNFTMPSPKAAFVSQPPSSGLGAEYDQAMQRLLEMGYFNKPRNAELLQVHKGDIQAVLEVLLVESDNDWAAKRH